MRYLQVQNDGTITDCIDYPHGDYIPFKGEVPLSVSCGWFKLIDGAIVEFPELKPVDKDIEIAELKSQVNALNIAIAQMMGV